MSKTLRATHGSPKTPLKLGEREIECYVLENGTRVLSSAGLQKAIALGQTSGDYFKRFINTGVLQPFIKKDLARALGNPVRFIRPGRGGKRAIGYEGTKYDLSTVAGNLAITIPQNQDIVFTVFMKFDEPERATNVFRNLGKSTNNLNPFSGKYNVHEIDEKDALSRIRRHLALLN